MKRFLFSAVALLGMVGMVSAECYYVSPKVAPTRSQAVARARAYVGKQLGKEFEPTCKRGRYAEQEMWLCEDTVGSCEHTIRLEESVNRLYEQGRRGRLTPPGEGTYRTENGEEVYCDRAFGCRRKRGMMP